MRVMNDQNTKDQKECWLGQQKDQFLKIYRETKQVIPIKYYVRWRVQWAGQRTILDIMHDELHKVKEKSIIRSHDSWMLQRFGNIVINIRIG